MPDTASTLTPAVLLQLQEEERYRLAQALMRGPGQVLANALMEIEYSLPMLAKNPELAITGLAALRDELRDGLGQLKDYVAELQPPLLEEMGLGQSIKHYLERYAERTGIHTTCRGCERLTERFPGTIETALFRILQEALENVRVHASATAVTVELSNLNHYLRMVIQDNGHGFATQAGQQPKRRQLGLVSMRDRSELLGGQLQVFSEPRQGVRVVVRVPYHGNANLAEASRGGQHESENGSEQYSADAQDGKQSARKTAENGSKPIQSRRTKRTREKRQE